MRIIIDVLLLRLDIGIKTSAIFEGVTEIQISIHLVREKPDSTTYARPLEP
jgi:hypothetical protein